MAAKALRRGAVRMRSSLGSGHTSLNVIVSDISTLRRRLKDSIASQQAVSKSQLKWSQDERSPALQDILHQMNEITQLWLDAQQEYVVALKEYKRVFEHIVESEKKLDQARKSLGSWEDKERKYEKELVKGSKDASLVQDKLQYAKGKKNLALAEVDGQQRETEAVKLMSLKAGLLDHSRAWQDVGTKCSMFAQAERDLALLVPDISPQTDTPPTYTGVRESMQIVREVRRNIASAAPAYGSSGRDGSISLVMSPSSSYQPPIKSPSLAQDNNYDSFDSFDSDT